MKSLQLRLAILDYPMQQLDNEDANHLLNDMP